MAIQRTKHIVIALGLFERMTYEELENAFPGNSAQVVRNHLAMLRKQGFEFFPCSCEKHAPNGDCLGIEEAANE